MRPLHLAGLVVAVACAPSATVVAPRPPAPVVVRRPILTEAPANWHLLDDSTDHLPGISAERAYREVLAGREPKRAVVVAIVDDGVDTTHVGIRANLWTNSREIPGNGRDDDSNGYIDDYRGWNFIGGRDGRDVYHDTFEITRLYARCGGDAGQGKPAAPPRTPRATRPPVASAAVSNPIDCARISEDFVKQRARTTEDLARLREISNAIGPITSILRQALGSDSLTPARVSALRSTLPYVQQARAAYLQMAASGITPERIAESRAAYESRATFALNPAFDPRPIVGDHYADLSEHYYGNSDVMGPDSKHGTHVAGIVAAARSTERRVVGIAPAARIMAIRAVPDGDERDKDIANAIRYATDNGAHIINMSFGKGYSPEKSAVDEAVKYADVRGVLMIHAAGNDGEDMAVKENFPKPAYRAGGRAENWIEVGATSWKGGDSLVASFSNYGRAEVDVFAPGVDILSTVSGGGYERESGTSMAAPVVSGLAAMLMTYYPELTTAEVKRIILSSATRLGDQMVLKPGGATGERVRFSSLSATGGIVNALAAVRMADRMVAGRRK
ncbi:MAG: S8 family peptidase [Gemmatimonadaceae bacterium]